MLLACPGEVPESGILYDLDDLDPDLRHNSNLFETSSMICLTR